MQGDEAVALVLDFCLCFQPALYVSRGCICVEYGVVLKLQQPLAWVSYSR